MPNKAAAASGENTAETPEDQVQAATQQTLRQGPRPLPLHLTIAALTWGSSLAALPALKNGSPHWRPSAKSQADKILSQIRAADPCVLRQAVEGEILSRSLALLNGILAYRNHPYKRALPPGQIVWRDGTTELHDFGGEAKTPPLLFIPSLVNRSYILDLSRRRSLVRWLKAEGFHCLLVDWGQPGPDERDFGLTDYVAGRLDAILDVVLSRHGRPPLLVGYCMGGLLALSVALRRQRDISGLALLATPWDFHACRPRFSELGWRSVASIIDAYGELPADVIQALFLAGDPHLAIRKFIAFGRNETTGRAAEDFIALEDWLNDGVPLAAKVARECIMDWYLQNQPANGRWRIAGRKVDASQVHLPSYAVIPAQDRIVPPASAAALARAIPGCQVTYPPLGHIGMVASRAAREQAWRPLAEWIKGVSR